MICRFEYRRYALPFRAPVRTAHGAWPVREGVLVRITPRERGDGKMDAPASGWGEAAPIPWFGTESVEEIEAACRGLAEWGEAARFAAVPARLACLRHALAMAMENLRASDLPAAAGDPGQAGPSGAGRAAAWGVAALLPAGRAALAAIGPKAEAGFRVFKWKVGVGDVSDELALLDDVCAVLPAGAKLRLDANGAWDRRRAERWLERCADRPVEFLEQPVAATARGADDLLLGLAGDFPTPIALDESLVGEGDIARWLGAGWPGIFVVKPALLAEPRAALARLATAQARVVFSSALETAVGAQAALRLAWSWPHERRALGFGVWPLFAEARCDGPAAAPFLRREDVERIDPEAAWNALS